MFKPTSPNTQKAFTLVELLTVMVVLVALASITIKTTAQFSFDSRYQITEDRYDKIKTAILGNPNQTINGHPSISGFVADMGRLPSCIRELIDGYNCSTNSQDTAWNIYGLCTDSSTTPATITIEKAANCVTPKTWISLGIGAGWRGAYIETTNDPSNSNAFVDGWGRISSTDAANVCTDVTYTTQADCITNSGKWFNPNYGWFFDDTTTTNAIYIKSFGKDQALGGSEEFDKDFPENSAPAINVNDWKVMLPTTATVTVTSPMVELNFTSATSVKVTKPTITAGVPQIKIDGTQVTDNNTAITISNTMVSITIDFNQFVCINIYNVDSSTGISKTSIKSNNTLVYAGGSSSVIVPATFPTTLPAAITLTSPPPVSTFTLSLTPLTFGQIAFSLNQYDTATSTCTGTVISSAFNTSPKHLTILPRHNFVFSEDW